MERAERGRCGGIDMIRGRIQISADESSNSLVVKASEANLVVLRDLIRQLDTAPSIQTEIRVFPAKLRNCRKMLHRYARRTDNGSKRRQETREKCGMVATARVGTKSRRDLMRRRAEDGGKTIRVLLATVNISSSDRLNAVLVSSDPRNFPIIEKIIAATGSGRSPRGDSDLLPAICRIAKPIR